MKCRGFFIYSAACLLFLMISCAEDKTAPRNTSSSVSLLEDTDTIFDTSSNDALQEDTNRIIDIPSNDALQEVNKSSKFAIGDNLQDMIISQPDQFTNLLCYMNKETGQEVCLDHRKFEEDWKDYTDSSVWKFAGRKDSLVKSGTPASLELPLIDEFGLNRVVEHFHSNLLTCIIVAPRFSIQDEGYWAVMEQFHQWSKKNNVQVVAYVNDQENDPFDMKGALGLTLQVNATHRKYIYPLIENDLGMIVMYKGVILDKINLEDLPNDLPSLIKKVPQWKEKSIKK